MFKRSLYCSNCNRKIEDEEEIYANMAVPKHSVMIEIKAYLKKKSTIYCLDCFEKKTHGS